MGQRMRGIRSRLAKPYRGKGDRVRATRLCSTLVIGGALLLLAGPTNPALAQTPPDSDLISLNGEIDLQRLVDLCADRLELNIEYDRNTLKGSVTLRVGDPLTNQELWTLTNHLLASRGFTTVKSRTGLFSVVKTDAAPWLGTLDDLSDPGILPGYVTVAVRIENIPVDKAVEALKFILAAGNAFIVPMPPSNVVLLTDLRPRIERALELLEQIDVPIHDFAFEIRKTARLAPASLVQAATDILQARAGVTGEPPSGKVIALPDGSGIALLANRDELAVLRDVVDRLEEAEPVHSAAYSPQHFPLAQVATLIHQVLDVPQPSESKITPRGGFRIVNDTLTNSLIVTATSAQHEQIKSLVDRLDAMPAATRRQVRTYPIKNRDVEEVVRLLQGLIAARVLDPGELGSKSSVRRGIAQQTPFVGSTSAGPREKTGTASTKKAGGGSDESGTESSDTSEVSLAADTATNKILAVGEPRILDQLDELIERLDARQPQVMLEVIAVSFNEGTSRDLGVELQKLEQNGLTQVALSSVFGLFGGAPTGLDSVGGSGLTGLVLSPGDFSVLLRALRSVNEGRTFNRPQVLVNNNEEATFDSVLQQPFISTNASDTVATTSFGGTQDAGTTITVKPTIAEGDHLVLDYRVSLSEFLGDAASPSLPPPRQQNTLASIVTIPDGHTVILGGMEVETEGEAASGVPWLSELPLFGWLFESRSTTKTKTRFFVFLRASVMRHGRFEDLKYRSDHERDAATLPSGWPTLEPRIIR